MRVAPRSIVLALLVTCALVVTAAAEDLEPILALEPEGHAGWVSQLIVRNDYELISVSHDRTIRLWNLATGEPLRTLRPPVGRGFQGSIYGAALHPAGKLLAVAGETALTAPNDQRILLIDLDSGEMVRTLRGHTTAVRAVAFAPDGKLLASADERYVCLWEVATGRLLHTLTGHSKRIMSLAWSPDSSRLVSGSWDATARIWSAVDGRTLAVLAGHANNVLAVNWSRDGRTIATGGTDNAIVLWDYDGRQRQAFRNLDDHVETLAISADNRWLLYGWGDRKRPVCGSAVIDLVSGREQSRMPLPLPPGNQLACCFAPDGQTAISASSSGEIHCWSIADGHTVRNLQSRGRSVRAVGWSPDSRAIAWGTSQQTGSGIKGTHPLERSFCLEALDFGPRPDKNFQRSLSQFQGLEIERVKNSVLAVRRNGATISHYTLQDRDDRVRCRSLLTGERAVVGCDHGLFVFDVRTGRAIYNLPGHTDSVWALAPSPDGRFLISGGSDQTIEIWNLERYELVMSLFFAGDEWIAWTPQAYYAASVGGENLIGWLVNHGPDQMPTYYPASRFRRERYRPDVLRRVIATGSPVFAVRAANSVREASESSANQTPQVITLSASLPPEITIDAPTTDITQPAGSQLTISVTATPRGHDPVESLTLLVDGRPWETFRPQTKPPVKEPTDRVVSPDISAKSLAAAVPHRWTFDVPTGTHQVVVRAETARSHQLSRPLAITGTSDQSALPTLYVLAIGSSRPADARAITDQLAQQGKSHPSKSQQGNGKAPYGQVVTRVLTGTEVTRANVLAGLDWLKQTMTVNDTGIVFFSGQVAADVKGTDVQNTVQFLLPSTNAPAPVNAAGVSGAELQAALRNTRGQLLTWFDLEARTSATTTRATQTVHDYCFGDSTTTTVTDRTPAAVDELLRQLAGDDVGVQVLSAAGGLETSLVDGPAGRSYFARALAEGLTQAGDADGDHVITSQELTDFVREHVRQWTDERQHPITGRSPLQKSLPLVRP